MASIISLKEGMHSKGPDITWRSAIRSSTKNRCSEVANLQWDLASSRRSGHLFGLWIDGCTGLKGDPSLKARPMHSSGPSLTATSYITKVALELVLFFTVASRTCTDSLSCVWSFKPVFIIPQILGRPRLNLDMTIPEGRMNAWRQQPKILDNPLLTSIQQHTSQLRHLRRC